jgi:hypothetical protein
VGLLVTNTGLLIYEIVGKPSFTFSQNWTGTNIKDMLESVHWLLFNGFLCVYL